MTVRVDLDAASRDPLAFADLAGVELSALQAEAIRGPVLGEGPVFSCLLAPRQTGKSRTLAVAAAWAAVRRAGVRVLVVSASEDASRRLLREVLGILAAPALRASITEESTALVRLSNGSEIRSTTASERAVRGWSVDLLIVDEAVLVPDDLLQGAALPTIAARPDARVILASSAGPARGTFYDLVMAGEGGGEHVALHRWTLEDAPWITASAQAALREGMSELRARAELDNQFAGQADLLFPAGSVARAVVDVDPPRLAGIGEGQARVWAGVDWGAVSDRSALVAVARVPEAGPRRFIVAEAFAWPAGHVLVGPGSVVDMIVSTPAAYGRVTAERNGLGEACCQELGRRLRERAAHSGGGERPEALSAEDRLWQEVDLGEQDWLGYDRSRTAKRRAPREPVGFSTQYRPTVTSAEMKAAMFSGLRLLIERGALLIPAAFSELIRELTLLRVSLLPSGGERIEASHGHDDLAMALGLALGPYQSRGRWRLALAERADPSAAVPAAHDGAGRGEVVSTAGGVSLPRRPLLQSIDWPHVTAADTSAPAVGGELHLARARVAQALTEQKGITE